jgi:glycosyltransferase involved in cell wall biosynthesis
MPSTPSSRLFESDPVWLSLIIAAYNAEGTIATAIRSALGQRGASYEVIVVDDGSKDDTLRIARELAEAHDNLTVLTQANGGTARAVNAGLGVARGDLIARLDSDDELTGDYLESMATFVHDHPDYDIYAPDIWMVRTDGLRHRVFGWNESRILRLEALLEGGFIPGPATMVRRHVVDTVSGFRIGLHNEDHDLWMRALASGARAIYVPRALYLYKQSAEGQKTANMRATHESNLAILGDLVRSGSLSDSQEELALTAIAREQRKIAEIEAHGGLTEDQIMADSASARLARLRRSLLSFMPERAADAPIRAIYSVRWIVRPLRRLLWRMRFWVGSRSGSRSGD